jgi:hypothetical protein
MSSGERGTAMDIRQAARRWADTWARAWPERDVEAIVALQARDYSHVTQGRQEPPAGIFD